MSSLLKDITNFVNKQLGLDIPNPLDKQNDPNSRFVPPWMNGTRPKDIHSTKNEVFFPAYFTDPVKWNQFFPYRLLVVDIANGNTIVGAGGGLSPTRNRSGRVESAKGIEYVLYQEARSNTWEMVLPITPQQLSIQDQFAINTSATMRGVVEEHNGVKFKMISGSGTTGVWPLKPTEGSGIARPTVLGSIFGGTFQAVNNFIEQAQNIKSIVNGEHPDAPERAKRPGETGQASIYSTGYYQALYLGQFLERYAQAKKDPSWKNYRLILDMPKIEQSFVVTPMSFSLNRSEQRPNEFIYSFQFKAWKRIELNESVEPAASSLPSLGDTNVYQRIVGTISQTRRTLGAATNIIRAVRSDAQGVFDNLRQVSLIVKDAAGLANTVIDLPRQIIQDLNSAIEDTVTNTLSAFNPPTDRFRDQPGLPGAVNKFANTSGLSPASKAGVVAQSISNKKRSNEGLSTDAVSEGALGQNAADGTQVDTLNNVFANPEENFEFFDGVSVDQLQLSPEQSAAIEDEIDRARLTTIDDLREIKQDLINLSNQIANNFGAGSEEYSRIYGLPDPTERALSLTVEENEILVAIFESIQSIDLLTASKQFDTDNQQSSLEFVSDLANESGIDFETLPSKISVPVPINTSIEEIAARYLGDSNRWLEIATINNLRSPYIDEEGLEYSLLSNASGRQLNVNDTESRLYIGQPVILKSDTIPAFSRNITNLEKIGENNFLVTLDGLDDLDILTTLDNATIQSFLPGTVNSQSKIFIPVATPASVDDDQVFDIPGISDNRLAKISKVDFLLTDNFDIAINSVGDFRLAAGLANLTQALKMKIRTQKGTLLRHLDYGLGIQHGVSVADIENGLLLQQLNTLVTEDPRFQTVSSATFRLSGSSLLIDMTVELANDNGVLPINFDLRVS